MQRINSFNDNDVLCGRGGATLKHPGNKKYRSLIKSNKPLYLISSKNEKTAMSRSIVAAIRKANGRFLERSKDQQTYFDIGDAKATEKTSQALREGLPRLRQKMKSHGVITNESTHSISADHLLTLLPTKMNQIDPNPVFVGDDSYSSINRNDMGTASMSQQFSVMHQSLEQAFADINPNPIMDDRMTIGDCRFVPVPDFQFKQLKHSIVTPPATPPNPPQQVIERNKINNNLFTCPILCTDMGMNDYDDNDSIETFEMEDEGIIEDDEMDVQPTFQASPPFPSLMNHYHAMCELKNNIPIYNGCDRQTFSAVSSNSPPTMDQSRPLTQLNDHLPTCSSTNDKYHNFPLNDSKRFNGNMP